MSLPKSKLMLISIICITLLAVAALLILEDKDAINTVESSKTSQNAAPADQEGILRIDEAKSDSRAIGCGHKCGYSAGC